MNLTFIVIWTLVLKDILVAIYNFLTIIKEFFKENRSQLELILIVLEMNTNKVFLLFNNDINIRFWGSNQRI